MAVERFKGTYVEAEDAKLYIDITTIEEGCNELLHQAESMNYTSDDIHVASEHVTKEDLSIQGINMEEDVVNVEENFKVTANELEDYAHTILESAYKALDDKQIELNEEAKKLDQIEIEKHKQKEEMKMGTGVAVNEQ